jgi:hypothetical protein
MIEEFEGFSKLGIRNFMASEIFSIEERAVSTSFRFLSPKPILQRMAKFVERRIEEANGDRQSLHGLENLLKSAFCKGRSLPMASARFSFDPAKIISRTIGSGPRH